MGRGKAIFWFVKDNIAFRRFRYVYKLCDLHLNVENYTEAAFTLLRRADDLKVTQHYWSRNLTGPPLCKCCVLFCYFSGTTIQCTQDKENIKPLPNDSSRKCCIKTSLNTLTKERYGCWSQEIGLKQFNLWHLFLEQALFRLCFLSSAGSTLLNCAKISLNSMNTGRLISFSWARFW